jgi:hypothetical protein
MTKESCKQCHQEIKSFDDQLQDESKKILNNFIMYEVYKIQETLAIFNQNYQNQNFKECLDLLIKCHAIRLGYKRFNNNPPKEFIEEMEKRIRAQMTEEINFQLNN